MPDSSEKFLQKTGNYRALHAYRKPGAMPAMIAGTEVYAKA